MNLSSKTSFWQRWADFTIRYDRIIVGAVLEHKNSLFLIKSKG